MHRIGRIVDSRILIVSSCLLLAATTYLYITYGRTAYFVAFHKPFHFITFGSPATYAPPVLPHFTVTSSVASATLSPGESQVITVTETPNRSVQGYIQVWIQPARAQGTAGCDTSCHGLNVYQNDTNGNPTQFIKDKTTSFTYTYILPSNLPAGTYDISDIITSGDTFTDYYVHNNFAEFNVQ